MDSRAVKMFFACALGGGVGSVVALSVHFYLWWVGLLAGGAVGYFSYEFREVLKAMRIAALVAWRETVSTPPAVFLWISRTIKSREFRVATLRVSVSLLPAFALASSLAFLTVSLDTYIPIQSPDGNESWRFMVGIPGFVLMVVAIVFPIGLFLEEKKEGGYRIGEKAFGITALCLTPLGLGLLAVGLPAFGIGWTLLKSPKIAKFCWVFVKTLFLTIHSDIRLLCGVDAAIGALIGFFLINPIIGAVAGGIIGVLNYKLISQRWLRLHLREQNG